ncbi:Hypothetical predicted protein [Cloeon dipterum]|uniref:RING-type domain-containing protein n=1 Tax=Cloeon dipterum TaxID=197152 RepID=A0A8S1DUU2_9INSE|nr:Hypothetical predicted protein [Cloeon dipterum]
MEKLVSAEGVRAMSDNELSDALFGLGLGRTPVTNSTRPWLEKKLLDKLEWSDRIEPQIDEKQQQHSLDTINNSINDIIAQGPEPDVPDDDAGNRVYYAVFCPNDNAEDDFAAESRVFNLQEEALRFAKKNKRSRFKAFRAYEEALSFATSPAAVQVTSPQPSSPGFVDGVSRFKGPKSQDLVQLRKEIENGNINMVRRMIWENPRYLISNGDMPSILQEGARYNALHVAARKGSAEMAALIADTISDTKFVQLLYGDCLENCRQRSSILLDLYLNMPDKGLHETPLHIAAKLGAVRCVEVFVGYPECKKNQLNKEKLTPAEIICSRQSPHPSAAQEIRHLLQDTFFVPVLRSPTQDQPEVGDPFSTTKPLVTSMEVSAFAGPMELEHAKVFHRQWKSPSPRVKRPLSTARLSDFTRGLERDGRDLARLHNVKWKEFWPFLGIYTDLGSEEGLMALEEFFKSKFSEQPDTPSPLSDLCDSFRSVSLTERQVGVRRPPPDPPRLPELSQNPLQYIETTCQVLARRLADGLERQLQAQHDRRGLKGLLHAEAKNMQRIVLSFRSEHQFSTSVDYTLVHSRIATLARHYLRRVADPLQLAALFANLQSIVTSDLDLSSDDEQQTTTDRSSSVMREQVQCVGRMLVRGSADVPMCESVEWMWAQCRSCCCSWLPAQNVRTPRTRGSSLKRPQAHRQQQQQYNHNHVQILQQQQQETPPRNNNQQQQQQQQQWRQPKHDSDESSDDDDDSEDHFFTPPSSVAGSDDEDDFQVAEQGRMVFINGNEPSKLDLDVLRACESQLLSQSRFPFVWRWRHQIRTFPETDRLRWRSPQVGVQQARSPSSPVRSPVSTRKVLPQSWTSSDPPFSPPRRRLNLVQSARVVGLAERAAESLEAQQERMRRAGEALSEGGTALCRRLTLTVAVLLLLSGRAFADWGYEEIEYTMAVLNASYPGSVEKPAELGKFSEGHIAATTGVLVHVQSGNNTSGADHACQLPLRASTANGQLPQEPWIALIRRGQCSYDQKVDNAFKSNASAVLIFNDRESPVLQKMRVSTHRDISAVFTYLWKGESLAQRVDNGTRVMLSIGVGSFCSRPYSSINRTSVLFVSISFIVLMIISLTWLVFYYVQRFRYIHAKDRLARRLCSAAKKALSKIPTKNIHSEDKEIEGEGECCAICIEPYKVSDVIRILPCRHEFHKPCIDPWLLEHRTCPMCKMDILKFYGYNFTGSQESILQIEVEEPTRAEAAAASASATAGAESGAGASGGGRQARGSVGTVTIDPQSAACLDRAELVDEQPTSSSALAPHPDAEHTKGETSKVVAEESERAAPEQQVEETLVVPFASTAAQIDEQSSKASKAEQPNE